MVYSNTIDFYNKALHLGYYKDIFLTGMSDDNKYLIVMKNFNYITSEEIFIATSPTNILSAKHNSESDFGAYRVIRYINSIKNIDSFFDSILDGLLKFGYNYLIPSDAWFFVADILHEDTVIFAKIVDADGIDLNPRIDFGNLTNNNLFKRNYGTFKGAFYSWLELNFAGSDKDLSDLILKLDNRINLLLKK
jgi:hypothetical protein